MGDEVRVAGDEARVTRIHIPLDQVHFPKVGVLNLLKHWPCQRKHGEFPLERILLLFEKGRHQCQRQKRE